MTIDYSRLIELIQMVVSGEMSEACDGNIRVYRVKYGIRITVIGV